MLPIAWSRRDITPMLAALVLVAAASCASVDASEDFRDTAREIRERTGSAAAWEPGSSAEVIRTAIDQMLIDDALTVDEAVRVALLSNPGLQASFMDVGVKKADLVQAGLLQNPVFSVSTRFPEGGGLVNLTLSITQSLIDLLLIPARERAGESRLAAARGAVVRGAVVLAGRVEGEVLDLIALRTARSVAEESLALAERSRDLARARFSAGLSDRVDVLLTEAAALDARREIVVVDRDRAVGRAALQELLGLDGARTWHVAGDLALVPAAEPTEMLVAMAVARRLDVQVARLLVDATRGDLDVEESSVIKQLAVGFQRERGVTPPNLTGPSIQAELPLFSRNEPGIARESFRLVAAERNLARLRQTVAREVREAATRSGAALALVKLFQDDILPAAQAAVETSRRAWQAGEREVLTLLAAQRFLVDQRRKYATALREAARARANLDIAMGGPIGASEGP